MAGVATITLLLLVACAAVRDVLTRTIPDWVSAGIAVIGVLLGLRAGMVSLAESLAGAAVLFLLLFLAYVRHAIGGGDVKLATAVAIGLPPAEMIRFVIATVLVGGIIGLVYAALRRLTPRPAGRSNALAVRLGVIECWRARRFNSVPYGLAIASGAGVVLLPTLMRLLPAHA